MIGTYPEDTNGVERTIWWPVRLDHAEHAMELPEQEEHNEQVVRVPEHFKASTAPLLHREKHHHSQTRSHRPSGGTGASGEVGR